MSFKLVEIIHNKYTAWIILLCSLLLTLGAWMLSKEYAEQIARNKFDLRAHELSFAVKQRMNYYEQSLWGGVGLFNASDTVTRDGWNKYISSINLEGKLPGIQAIGYAVPLIDNAAKIAFEKRVRSEGFPDFKVNPEGQSDNYTSILYISPFDWRNKRAFGYDMYSNSIRRKAMDLATLSGKAATSGVITLVQETDENVQKGFLTYVPVFENENIAGWVYAAFRANDLFENIFGEQDKDFDFQIVDENEESQSTLLYSSASGTTKGVSTLGDFVKNMPLNIQGRKWLLQMYARPSFTKGNNSNLPNWVVAGGLFIDILLFYVIFTLYNLHHKARSLASNMTKEINAKKEELEQINSELRQFAYATTHDVKAPVNSIANFVGLLKDDKSITNELSQEAISWIDMSVNKALTTIQALVDVVELKEVDKFEAELINIEKTINKILADFKPQLQSIEATIETSFEISTLNFNSKYFKIVIENLVSNAIKYKSDERDLSIKIQVVEESNWYVLSVKDNGIGINLDKYEDKVFGLFKRAHDHVEGSGFGLYMVKNVIEKEGGKSTVDSVLNEGTTFNVYFKK